MNYEEEIVDNVLFRMTDLSAEQLRELKNAIKLQLCNYDIKQKEVGLMCLTGNGFNYLEKFKMNLSNSGRSQGTIDNYDLHISRFLTYINKNVEDITGSDIIEYFDKYKRYRDVSLGYLNDIRLAFNSFFRFLQKRKFITYNPVDEVDAIKTKYVIQKPFTAEEMIKIRSSCKNLRDKALVEFLYSSAVRVSELTSLNIKDINWREDECIVCGKGNKERAVFLNASAHYYLMEYLKTRTDDNEALFVGLRKPYKRLTKSGVEEICRKLGKAAGVEDVHPHKFRRTAATDLLNMGMPIEQVQEFLGHEKIDTTRIYCTVDHDLFKLNYKKFMVA